MKDLDYIKKMLDHTDEILPVYGDIQVPKEYYNNRALLMAEAIRLGCEVTIEKEQRMVSIEKRKVSDVFFEKEKEEPLKKYIHVMIDDVDYMIQDKYLIKVMNDEYDNLVLGRGKNMKEPDAPATKVKEKSYEIYPEKADEKEKPSYNKDIDYDDDEEYELEVLDDEPQEEPDDTTEPETEPVTEMDEPLEDYEDEESKELEEPEYTPSKAEPKEKMKEDEYDDPYGDPYAGLEDYDDTSDGEQPVVMNDDGSETDSASAISEESDDYEDDAAPAYTGNIENRLPVFKNYPKLQEDPNGFKYADSFLYNKHRVTVNENGRVREYVFYVYPLGIEKNSLSTDIFVVGVLNEKNVRAGVSRGKTSSVNISFDDIFLIRGSWKNGLFNSQITLMSNMNADIQDELLETDTRKRKTQYTYLSIPAVNGTEIYVFPGAFMKNDDSTGLTVAAMAVKTEKDVMVLSPTQEGTFAINNGATKIECYWIADKLQYTIL